MVRLFFKNFSVGLMSSAISVAVTAALFALFGWLGTLLKFPFSAIPLLIIGGALGLMGGAMLGVIIFRKKPYFKLDDTTDNFWVNRIKAEKFIKKGAAYSTFLPHFLLSAGGLAVIILFYDSLNAMSQNSYIVACILFGIFGAFTVSLLAVGIAGIKSFTICRNCGGVNTMIFQDDEEFVSASGFTGESYNYNYGVHHGISQGGGGYDTQKLSNYADRACCKCACCKEEVILTQRYK